MGNFVIKSQTTNAQYEYSDNAIIVQGNYVKDASNGTLQSISGSCYRNQDVATGDYLGNFNGYMRDGEIKYSVSEMSRKDSNLVWTAIGEIEPYVLGENQEENAGE